VKIVLESKGGAVKIDSNLVDVAVTLKDLDIRVEDPDDSTDARFKGALDNLKKELAANSGTGRIVLDTPVFLRKSDFSDLDDDSSYQDYKKEFGDALVVPLLARVWLKGKDGTKKRSVHALQGVRVLWDVWLDDDGSWNKALVDRGITTGDSPKTTAFLKKVTGYKKDDTQPKGRAAHQHLGGSRAAPSKYFDSTYIWSKNDGAKRTWAVLSECKNVDQTDADTGVKLKPGRLATDSYHLKAYTDVDGSLDTTDDKKLDAVPAERKSAQLAMTVWRRIEINTVYKLGANTPDMAVAPIAAEYKRAGMIVDPAATFMNADLSSTYKTLYMDAVAEFSKVDTFIANATEADPEDYPARFVSFGDFKDNIKKIKPPPAGLVMPKDDKEYGDRCDSAAQSILKRVAYRLGPFPNKGVVVFSWKAPGGSIQNRDSKVGGFADVSPYGSYGAHNTAFFIFRTDNAGYTHELGHCLYLAHQPGSDDDHPPAGANADAHDEAIHCVMSYHNDAKHPCGSCILKVAGWDTCGPDPKHRVVDKDGNVA
jgi:hypothetical protein